MLILVSVISTLVAGAAFELLSGEDGDEFGGAGDEDNLSELPVDDGSGPGESPLDQVISGNGELVGGAGDDLMTGGGGQDDLTGGDGDDTLYGGGGDDWLFGDDMPEAAGRDELHGGAGDDTLAGNGGGDRLSGDAGDDRLYGGEGDDTLDGGAGDDWLTGSAGDDLLRGGAGNDDLSGGAGNDTLIGGACMDYLHGGEGDDEIHGGAGDWLDGNEGEDVFILTADAGGMAHLSDLEPDDRIEILVPGPAARLEITPQEDGSAVIGIDGQPVLRVLDAAGLSADQIRLVTG